MSAGTHLTSTASNLVLTESELQSIRTSPNTLSSRLANGFGNDQMAAQTQKHEALKTQKNGLMQQILTLPYGFQA